MGRLRWLGRISIALRILFPPLWLIVALFYFGKENWMPVFAVALISIAIGGTAEFYRMVLHRQLYSTLADIV